jgi:hypothetical protein
MSSVLDRTAARKRQPYLPRECAAPPLEVVSLDEILGLVAPIDFLAALAGHRGAALHIGGAPVMTEMSPRRDVPVICISCGKRCERKARQQVYCSTRCRKRGHYGKIVARGDFSRSATHDTALGTTPPKKQHHFNSLQAPKSGSSIPINVLGGYRWADAVPIDPATLAKIMRAEIGGVAS